MGCVVKTIESELEVGVFANCFNAMFAVQVANTEELRREAYRLRYRVYCEERGFERSEHFPDREEYDEFDKDAVHAVVRHRGTGSVIGAVRLILRNPADRDWSLPVEKVCGGLFERKKLISFNTYRRSVAEVSRFAVSKGAVAEVAELTASGLPAGFATEDFQSVLGSNPFQNVALGLIAALFQMSAAHGIQHWYALMEPALARHLARLGLRFAKIGPLVNHRGKRQPMLANLVQLRQAIAVRNPQLSELIETDTESLKPRAWPAKHGRVLNQPRWVRRRELLISNAAIQIA